MAKDQKIIIEFDRNLAGDVEYVEPVQYEAAETPLILDKTKAFGSSAYSESYSYDLAFDGNINSYWRTASSAMPQYIGIDIGNPKAIRRIDVYVTGNYPKDITIQASNDNVTYVDICNTTFITTISGWQSINIFSLEKYQYWKVNITSIYSSTLMICEISLFEAVKKVNAKAFTVKSKEYDYVPGGTLQDKTYKVKSVQRLKFKTKINFESAELTNTVYNDKSISLKEV